MENKLRIIWEIKGLVVLVLAALLIVIAGCGLTNSSPVNASQIMVQGFIERDREKVDSVNGMDKFDYPSFFLVDEHANNFAGYKLSEIDFTEEEGGIVVVESKDGGVRYRFAAEMQGKRYFVTEISFQPLSQRYANDCIQNLKNIGTIMEAYYADMERYPTGSEPEIFDYLNEELKCPVSNQPYIYVPAPKETQRYGLPYFERGEGNNTNRIDRFAVLCPYHTGENGKELLFVTHNGIERF